MQVARASGLQRKLSRWIVGRAGKRRVQPGQGERSLTKLLAVKRYFVSRGLWHYQGEAEPQQTLHPHNICPSDKTLFWAQFFAGYVSQRLDQPQTAKQMGASLLCGFVASPITVLQELTAPENAKYSLPLFSAIVACYALGYPWLAEGFLYTVSLFATPAMYARSFQLVNRWRSGEKVSAGEQQEARNNFGIASYNVAAILAGFYLTSCFEMWGWLEVGAPESSSFRATLAGLHSGDEIVAFIMFMRFFGKIRG